MNSLVPSSRSGKTKPCVRKLTRRRSFLKRVDRPAKPSAFARLVPSAMSAWNMHSSMMRDLVFGVGSQIVSVDALSARLANNLQGGCVNQSLVRSEEQTSELQSRSQLVCRR